jgi:hypothetical protein
MALAATALALSAGLVKGADRPLNARLAGLRVMHIHPGVNTVPNFAGDGRGARIVEGWRDNGNAHGYHLYVVLLPVKPGGTDWNVVGVDDAERFEDTVADAPHTGEDIVRRVVFARGLLDGHDATLLLMATRQWRNSIPEPAITEIRVYELRRNDGDVGETQDYFQSVGSYLTKIEYCNADNALKDEFGIPLPRPYAGGPTKTGC